MTPTPAQIEAALREAIDEVIADGGNGHVRLDGAWLDKAQAALKIGVRKWTDEMVQQRIDAAIERCAQVAEEYGLSRVNDLKDYPATVAAAIVYRIRALKDK